MGYKINTFTVRDDEITICDCGQDIDAGTVAHVAADHRTGIEDGRICCSRECAERDRERLKAWDAANPPRLFYWMI